MNREDIQQLYNKYKLIIYPLAVILASLILIVLVIYPQLTKLFDGQRVHSEITQKTSILEVKASELENINQAEVDQKIEAAVAALPADRDYPSVIGALQDVIAKNSFTLSSMQIGVIPSSIQNNLNGFNMKVEVVGPRALLGNLLNALENAPRAMKISGIELVPQSGSGIFNAIISIDVFYAPVPTSLGAIDAPISKLSDKDEQIIAKVLENSQGFSIVTSSPASLPPRGKSNPFE